MTASENLKAYAEACRTWTNGDAAKEAFGKCLAENPEETVTEVFDAAVALAEGVVLPEALLIAKAWAGGEEVWEEHRHAVRRALHDRYCIGVGSGRGLDAFKVSAELALLVMAGIRRRVSKEAASLKSAREEAPTGFLDGLDAWAAQKLLGSDIGRFESTARIFFLAVDGKRMSCIDGQWNTASLNIMFRDGEY